MVEISIDPVSATVAETIPVKAEMEQTRGRDHSALTRQLRNHAHPVMLFKAS
jgi:hypothetical protein